MVSHGGYDNSDVNKDINCMFPIDRIHELAADSGFIKSYVLRYMLDSWVVAETRRKFKHETGPAVAEMFKNEDVDAVILTAG